MSKRVVVTGGAGFIGSHLVDLLLKENNKVTVIDNFSNGRIENLKHHKDDEDLEIVKADISIYDDIKNHFVDVDWVFHLAALADIVPSIQNPLKYHNSNINGTINVLEAARNNDIKRFIYTASSSCYGIPDKYPTPETAPIKPEYPYALTKYIGEQMALSWNHVYNLPVVSLRLFNVYGPRARTSGTYGAVFGVFLAQKINKEPFTIVGNGNQTRDFTFVTDITNGFLKAAKSNVENEAINLGSGNTYSINKLVELLEGESINIPKRPGEPDCTFADITKAKRLIDYNPSVSFEEGVRIMIENIDYWKNAPVWTPEKIQIATKDWFTYLSK